MGRSALATDKSQMVYGAKLHSLVVEYTPQLAGVQLRGLPQGKAGKQWLMTTNNLYSPLQHISVTEVIQTF